MAILTKEELVRYRRDATRYLDDDRPYYITFKALDLIDTIEAAWKERDALQQAIDSWKAEEKLWRIAEANLIKERDELKIKADRLEAALQIFLTAFGEFTRESYCYGGVSGEYWSPARTTIQTDVAAQAKAALQGGEDDK